MFRYDIIIGSTNHSTFRHHPLNTFTKSLVYDYDDLVWCVQKSKSIPIHLNLFNLSSAEIWTLNTIMCFLVGGLMIFILMQFDENVERRNINDLGYSLVFIMLPAMLGIPSRFDPKSLSFRVLYALVIVLPQFFHAMIGVFLYRFLKVNFYFKQIATVHEIAEKGFRLMGSVETLNHLKMSSTNQFPREKIEAFFVCNDINACLEDLKRDENYDLAISGRYQQIINSPAYTVAQIFCFDKSEKLFSYPISMLVSKSQQSTFDGITYGLFEFGLIQKWKMDSQKKNCSWNWTSDTIRTQVRACLSSFIGILHWSHHIICHMVLWTICFEENATTEC